MKKIISFLVVFAIAMFAVSCDETIGNVPPPPPPWESSMSESRCAALAEQTWAKLHPTADESEMAQVDLNSVIKVPSSDGQFENVYYVFDFKDNKGFALITPYPLKKNLIAIIEHGNYEQTVNAGCEAFNFKLSKAIEEVDNYIINYDYFNDNHDRNLKYCSFGEDGLGDGFFAFGN